VRLSPRAAGLVVVLLAAATGGCATVGPAPTLTGYSANGTAALERDVDRPGADYRAFDLSSGRPETCRDTCLVEPRCQAFTYVAGGLEGPTARCRLKSAAPPPAPRRGCLSGVRKPPPSTADGAACCAAEGK